MGERKAKWQNTYIANHYDRINLTVPQGQKAVIKAAADARGQSVNGYILSALAAFGAFDASTGSASDPAASGAGDDLRRG